MTTATAAVTATPPTAEASLFPAYDRNLSYGVCSFSGRGEHVYQAEMIEMAIRRDSVPMLQETIARGWLAPSCRAFDESLVVDYAEMRGAKAVPAYLRSLGWPERRAASADESVR